MRIPVLRACALAALAAGLHATPAAAQLRQAQQAPGWTLTPTLAANTSWDDNALLRNSDDETPADLVNVVNPRLDLSFLGRRGQVSANYDGAFSFHRELSGLNSYGQHANLSARRLMTRRVTAFAQYQAAATPTTEQVELIGVPYVRTGAASQVLRGGIEASLTRRSSLSASYSFQQVRFEESDLLSYPLPGGHSHGASVGYSRTLTARTSITAAYDMQGARVGEVADAFEVHRAEGGVEHRPLEGLRVFGAAGLARVVVRTAAADRTGLSWRAGFGRDIERATVEVAYARAFVPSYGFGGTQENEELTARFRLPLARALYTQSGFAWRRNEPLAEQGLKVRTLAVQALVGYALAPWAGIEGFFDSSHHRIDQPGGTSHRRRIGVQIVTSKPMRIR